MKIVFLFYIYCVYLNKIQIGYPAPAITHEKITNHAFKLKIYIWTLWSSFRKLTQNQNLSVLLPIWGENTRGYQFHTKAIEFIEHVRGRPARSSTNICQRGAVSQFPGGRNTCSTVSSQPKRARHTLCLISPGIHYPVGHPLLGDGILSRELVWGPEALCPVNVASQCSDGIKQS